MSDLRDDEIKAHGEMRPPWSVYPYHPISMGWRMGVGEGYKFAFWDWWSDVADAMSVEERLAYLKRWPGRAAWAHVMIEMVWDLDGVDLLLGEDDAERARWFARAEAVGLPSLAAHEADFNADDWAM